MCFAIFVTPALGVSASAQPVSQQARDYLEKTLAAYESLPPVSMFVETVEGFPKNEVPDKVGRQRILIQQFIDGDRVDFSWNRLESVGGQELAQTEKRGLWTGTQYQFRQMFLQPAPSNVDASVSDKYDQAKRLLTWPASGAFLMGYFPGDNLGLRESLQELQTGAVRQQREDIGGHDCVVLDLQNPRGHFTFWIDPSTGFHARKVRIEKQDGDLYHGKTISSESVEGVKSSIVEIDNIAFAEVQGLTIPISGRMTIRNVNANGTGTAIDYTSTRSDIRLNPDFEALGAFVMDGIPDGTHVWHQEMEGFPFIWKDGKPFLDTGKEIVDAINKEISAEFTSESDLPVRPQGAEEPVRERDGPSPGQTTSSSRGLRVTLGGVALGGLILGAMVLVAWRVRSKG